MRHFLALDVEEIYNDGIFVIKDTSVYASAIPVSCQNLQITPPGFHSPTLYTPTTTGFRYILNACTLGICVPTGCNTSLPQVPDGIYQLHYSVSPNDQVYVSYNYLRTTNAMNRLNSILCAIGLQPCLPTNEQETAIRETDIIRNYLRSAQLNCNEFKKPVDGMNQYRYAVQLMDKMTRSRPYCMNYGNGQLYN